MIRLSIRIRRKAKHITQEELALRIGVTQQYISQLESEDNTTNPPFDVLEEIANVLNVCPISLYECFHCTENGGTCKKEN